MQDLDTQERQIIQSIFHLAESKHCEEREGNPGTTFTLLKLLSAYNDILPRYGLSSVTESRIYNHLVSISKRYNPSSQQEWSIALSRASSISPLQMKDRLSQRRKTYNTPVSQFINESIDNSKISLNSKSRSRGSLKSIDKKHLLVHRNFSGDEIKEYDESREMFRKDYSKFDTTHNLTLSRDRMKTLLSFPTCNTQDSVEIYEQDHLDEERQREMLMEKRAELFRRVNVYSKVFLVIRVSIIVKEELKAQEMKVQARVERVRAKFGFLRLIRGIEEQKIMEEKNGISTKFHSRKLKSKTFKCLKTLKELSITPRKQNQTPLHNNISLSFLLHLLCLGLDKQSMQKFQYFWKQRKPKQLESLINLFSKHSFVKYQLFPTIKTHFDTNTKSTIFNAFKQNMNKHSSGLQSIAKVQKQEVFHKLHQQLYGRKDLKQKYFLCAKRVREMILGSAVWGWKKRLLKNCKKFMIVKHVRSLYHRELKSNIMEILRKQYQRTQQRYQLQEQSVKMREYQQGLDQLSKCFYALKKNYLMNKKQALQDQKAQVFRRKGMVSRGMDGLLKNILFQKQVRCLRRLADQLQNATFLRKAKVWRKAASARMMIKAVKKVELRSIFWQIHEAVAEKKLETENSLSCDKFYMAMIWDRLTDRIANIRRMREDKSEQIKRMVDSRSLIQSLCLIKCNTRSIIKQRRIQGAIESKAGALTNALNRKSTARFVFHLKSTLSSKLTLQNQSRLLQNYLKRRPFQRLATNVDSHHETRRVQECMMKTILKLSLIQLFRYTSNKSLKRSQKHHLTLLQNNRKNKQISSCFRTLKRFHEIIQCISLKSQLHYHLKLLSCVFLGLKKNTLIEKGIEEVCNRNIKRITNFRKNRVFKDFRCLIKKQVQVKQQHRALDKLVISHNLKVLAKRVNNQQLLKQISYQESDKMIKGIKTIYMMRLSRVFNLRPLNTQYLTKKIWLERFLKNVNNRMIDRKMNEMALLHYMQSILGKSIQMLKYSKDNPFPSHI